MQIPILGQGQGDPNAQIPTAVKNVQYESNGLSVRRLTTFVGGWNLDAGLSPDGSTVLVIQSLTGDEVYRIAFDSLTHAGLMGKLERVAAQRSNGAVADEDKPVDD